MTSLPACSPTTSARRPVFTECSCTMAPVTGSHILRASQPPSPLADTACRAPTCRARTSPAPPCSCACRHSSAPESLSRAASTWLAVATTSTAPRGEEWNPAFSTWPTKLCFQSNLKAWSSKSPAAEASRARSRGMVRPMVALVLVLWLESAERHPCLS